MPNPVVQLRDHPPRPAGPMSKPNPPSPYDEDDDSIPFGRLAVWGILAIVVALGLYLYFRYQPGIVPLNQKVD